MTSPPESGEPAQDEPGSVAVAGEPEATEAAGASAIAATSAPEVMAGSLGEYTRLWMRRVRSGESGALPVIAGLIVIGAYFQIREPAFLSAGNIANLMTQAGFLITFCMAQTFPLLLGLNGVLLWLFERTGATGEGGVIQDHNGFINGLVPSNVSPAAGWIILIVAVALGAVFMILRDQRRRRNGLVAPPRSVTLLKLAAAA